MYHNYDLYGFYDLDIADTERVEASLKNIKIPDDYKFSKEITKLKMASGNGIFINDDHVTSLDEHALYFYDICKFIQDGGKIEPTYTDEELLEMAKNKLKSDINSLASLNMYKEVTYNNKKYSSDNRSREAIANTISTYRERLPIDDGATLENGDDRNVLSDNMLLNQTINSKLPLPSEFKWITVDNEYVPFKMSDVLQLSALFQDKTYRCTFKAREFKDRLSSIKNIDELKALKEEVEKYDWS